MGIAIQLNDPELLVPPTKELFPSLAHVFDYAGCDFNAKTITCPISGVRLSFNTLNDQGNGWGTTEQPASVLGNMTAPEQKAALLLAVYPTHKNDGTGWAIGHPGAHYGMGSFAGGATSSPVYGYVTDSADALTNFLNLGGAGFVGTNKPNGCTATAIDFVNNTATTYNINDGESAVASANTTVGNGTISGGISQAELDGAATKIVMPSTAANVTAALYAMYFEDGLPTDIDDAVVWMAVNPGYLYPPWMGRK